MAALGRTPESGIVRPSAASAKVSALATRSRLAFWAMLVAVLCVLLEGGARLVEVASRHMLVEAIRSRSAILGEQSERIAILLDAAGEGREELDEELGWRYRPGFASATDNINRQGVRALREYESLATPHTLRVAAFGNSFVYANEVSDQDSWCAQLESSTPGLEVLNYGVGGYGLDQAYLRYRREGRRLRPDVVLVGFYPDDLRRAVNVYRRFVSTKEWPLTKPRYRLRDDQTLELLPNPLSTPTAYKQLISDPRSIHTLGVHDHWYDPMVYEHPLYDVSATLRVGYAVWQRTQRRWLDPDRLMRNGVFNERSSAFRLQVALLGAFNDAIRADSAIPVVLMLPNRASVETVRRGGLAEYAPLSDALGRHRLAVWDGMSAFRDSGSVESLFAPGGHYSPAGNRALAAWLSTRLDSLRPLATAVSTVRR
jgi:hypothetical protein